MLQDLQVYIAAFYLHMVHIQKIQYCYKEITLRNLQELYVFRTPSLESSNKHSSPYSFSHFLRSRDRSSLATQLYLDSMH